MLTNPNYLNTSQYRTAANLKARMELHGRFSTNPADWFRWVFDHFNLGQKVRILEVGCGNGNFWLRNRERIPPGWEVYLTDQSAGMIKDARRTLGEAFGEQVDRFKFEQVDVQELPYSDDSFDAVLANHMLYHVADRQKALAGIQRVLKKNGRLFTATNGDTHMYQLEGLLREFNLQLADSIDLRFNTRNFNLENGAAQLEPWFNCLEIYPYIDSLVVTEAAPLAAYVCSMVDDDIAQKLKLSFQELEKYFIEKLKQNGTIFIQKSTGLFVAVK